MKSMTVFITTLVLGVTITHASIPLKMTTHMNREISPCENFYQYACGNWINKIDLHPTEPHVELIDPLYDNVDDVLQEIISERPPLIRELWHSCMAIDKIDAVGNKPLQADLLRIANVKSHTHLFALMGEFSRTGTQAIVRMDVQQDRKDATVHTLFANKAFLTLPSLKYYAQDRFPSIESDYRAYINHVIKSSGYSFSGRSPANVVIKVEQSIARIQNQLRAYHEYPHFSIKDASKRWPITFGGFIQGVSPTNRGWTWLKNEVVRDLNKRMKVETPQIEMVQFESVQYFDLVEELVTTISIDDLKVYTAFVFVHSRIDWLGKDFLTAHFNFFELTLRGRSERVSREDFCLDQQMKYLPQLIGQYFVNKAFHKDTKTSATDLAKRIKNVMKHRISTLSWLDKSTQKEAKAKLTKLKLLLGHSTIPPTYTFTLSRDDYAANIFTILMDAFNTQMKKVDTPVNRKEWHTSPHELNAYNVPRENKVVFPAAMLQQPLFYRRSVHPARNFGAIGTIMGHEMTHGYDTVGNRFDAIGNERSWWTPKTLRAFNDRAMCFNELYSSFKMRELKVNGELTLHENIADSGGVSLAWDAYREYMTTVQPNTHDVTADEGDQMFFIAYAQTHCSKSRDEYIKESLIEDTHAPSQWRVNGVLMNNKDFAKVFKCDVNTPMNPPLKCKIW